MRDPNDPVGTAHHEAGHAVVAQGFGREVVGIWMFLEPHEGKSAKLEIKDAEEDDLKGKEEDIVVRLAGPHAEEKFLGMPPHPLAGSDDYEVAEQEIRTLLFALGLTVSDDTVKVFFDECDGKAKGLVDDNWEGIRTVAEALQPGIFLSGEAIAAIVQLRSQGHESGQA